jgi:uncharacterized protein DUF3558
VRVATVIVVAGVLVVLTACTVSRDGAPAPVGNTAPTSTSGSAETTDPRFADLLPPRPRELDLTGVQPCTDLLTDQQLRELDYDRGYLRPPSADHSDFHGGPDCLFGSTSLTGGPNRNMSSLVGISTTEGALAWVTDPVRAPKDRPEVVTVEGFSALVLPHPRLAGNCLVVVDTAQGQYLEVDSGPDVGEGPYDPYCAEAARVAGMAIQTLTASR